MSLKYINCCMCYACRCAPCRRCIPCSQGATGPTGPQGMPGPQGIQGEVGLQGPAGPQGIQGEFGPQGVEGIQGIQGIQGEMGPTGPAGSTGPSGANGTSVTILGSFDTLAELEAAHPVGNVGDAYLVDGDLYVWSPETGTWVNVGNIRGPQGETGPTGATGPQGIPGPTGPQGVEGIQGIQGIQGEMGSTGPQGPVGPQGIQGEAGPQGPAGPTGPSGAAPNAVYHANLSAPGSSVDVPVGNVIYDLQYNSSTQLTLFLRPATVPVLIDLKRSSQYDTTTVDGLTRDNYTLSTSLDIDTIIYNSSREMHRTWLRQQDPVTGLWTLDEIDLFASNGSGRITIWVQQIYANVAL